MAATATPGDNPRDDGLANLNMTTPIDEWLARVQLLSDQPEFIQTVSDISMGKLGFVFELDEGEWRTALVEKGQPKVLIKSFLRTTIPAAAEALNVTWPKTYVDPFNNFGDILLFCFTGDRRRRKKMEVRREVAARSLSRQ